MKTILLTGATGFVGRHIVEEALRKGFQIIASVRESSNLDFLKEKNIPFVYLSLHNTKKLSCELNELQNKYGNIEFVIHNAGVTQSLKNKSYYDVNFQLTNNLLNAVSDLKNPPKFIFMSSMAAIGSGQEFSLKPIRETDSPNPITHYGKSKLKAEELLMNQEIVPWIIVRPTAVYGPWEKNIFSMIKLVNNGFEFYVGSKEQTLSFIHVFDLADAVISLCESNISNEDFNLSDGQAYSSMRLNQLLKSILKKKTLSIVVPIALVRIIAFFSEIVGYLTQKAPILNCDKVNELKQINWICDNSKIIKELGFSPKFTLESGMRETIKWYENNGWL
jgi:nucleoside-diphosphate-sugar epimerase